METVLVQVAPASAMTEDLADAISRDRFCAAVLAESTRALLLAEAASALPADLAIVRDLHTKIVQACAVSTVNLSKARKW